MARRREAPALTAEQRADVEGVASRIRSLVYGVYGPLHYPAYTVEDVFQATMEAVCRCRSQYNPGGGASWPTYATNRAKGAILDYLRDMRPGSRAYPAENPGSLDEHISGDEGVTWIARLSYDDPEPHDHLLERQLWDAIDDLGPRKATAFRLYVEGGMTLAEVGEVLGITESAVSLRMKEARAALAPELQRLLGPMVPS